MGKTENSNRISALDGLRGYAALAVVFYHSILLFVDHREAGHRVAELLSASVWSVPTPDIAGRLTAAALNGEVAVLVFFAISGLVLTQSLSKSIESNWLVTSAKFAIKRVSRIYPALIACLIVFYFAECLLHAWHPEYFLQFTTIELLKNASLYAITIHGASWTLQAEIVAIPFVLVTYFAFQRFGWTALFLIACYSFLVREYVFLGAGSGSAYLWMPAFTAGIVAARIDGDIEVDVGWMAPLAGLLFTPVLTSPASITAAAIQIVSAFLLVMHIMRGADSALNRLLSNRPSQYLGKISYSLYLWNVPFLFVANCLLQRYAVPSHYLVAGVLVGSILTAISLPIAHLSEKYLEHAGRAITVRNFRTMAR